jgi:ankyrin repeat protein
MPAQPLNFNLSLDDPSFGDEDMQQLEDSDSRLVQMLAHQARLKNDNAGDEAKVVADEELTHDEKREALQGLFTLAASNGELERVKRLLDGKAREYIDVDAVDAEGTPPLVYASCFGHDEVAEALIKEGAKVDVQDKNRWTPLMWAMTNRHKDIVKLLLDFGASTDVRSSAGRTAFDFVEPNSEISDYLQESGYSIGNAGVTDDFYSSGFSQDRFEQEMQENDMKRRMMMESAFNLEVDIGNLGLDEKPEVGMILQITRRIADPCSRQKK